MRKILLFCEYDEKQNENIHTEIDPYGEEIWEPTKLENYLELLLLLGIKDAVIVNNPEHITFTYSHDYIYILFKVMMMNFDYLICQHLKWLIYHNAI